MNLSKHEEQHITQKKTQETTRITEKKHIPHIKQHITHKKAHKHKKHVTQSIRR